MTAAPFRATGTRQGRLATIGDDDKECTHG